MVAQAAVAPSVQDLFLGQLLKAEAPVTVFLANGVKLQGQITGFDRYDLTLTRNGATQLVFKHSISTVMPGSSQDSLSPDAPLRREARREGPASGTRLSLVRRAG